MAVSDAGVQDLVPVSFGDIKHRPTFELRQEEKGNSFTII
jgi:hypothetical protein